MGDVFLEAWKLLFDIVHERRAARACKKALFGKLLRLRVGDHISAPGGLDYAVEAELLNAGDNLPKLCVAELAGNRRRDYGVQLIFRIVLALLDELDYFQDKRFIVDCAERALIGTSAAGNTFVVIDFRGSCLFVHADCLDLAGTLTRALVVCNRAVWADLRALSAFDAF